RSGGRNLARGTRFLRTPGKNRPTRSAPREGCEESSTPFQGAKTGRPNSRWYALKNTRVPPANFPARLRRAQPRSNKTSSRGEGYSASDVSRRLFSALGFPPRPSPAVAPRSAGRNFSQGYAFFAYPWKE